MTGLTRRAFLASAAVALVPYSRPLRHAYTPPQAGAHGHPQLANEASSLSTDDRARSALIRRPVPSPAQLVWQQDELALFVHFGMNTFTNREWGDGQEDPRTFAPTQLDPRQWARAARAAGFRAMMLTAKHHDGFCLWPTRTTSHSVRNSTWRNGEGDVVRMFVDACRTEGLRPGLYCSPWDRHEPSYGDSPRYNDLYTEQLTELLTRYGEIHEVWFDGANGEGPNGRRQQYDWPRFWGLVRRLQPGAVMFSDAGPDIRWIGNELGTAGDPNWATMNPDTVPYPGMSGDHVIRQLQHGDPDGSVWRPGECDVSIRPGWFHHAAEDDRVRSARELVDLYFASVGRNSKLLLNVPATTAGLLHDIDVARLATMRNILDDTFRDLVFSSTVNVAASNAERTFQFSIDRSEAIGLVDLREPIENGQAVARYSLEGLDNGGWTTLATGTTIGHRKLDRCPPRPVQRIRFTIEDAIGWPVQVGLRLFGSRT